MRVYNIYSNTNVLLGLSLPCKRGGARMDILDILTIATELFNLMTSEGNDIVIIPVRFVGKPSETKKELT